MYLLYIDESGTIDAPEREHIVIAGCAVHETLARPLARLAESVLTRHLEPHQRRFEIHAQHMVNGKGPWRNVQKATRQALLLDLCGQITDFRFAHPEGFATFAMVREPGAMPGSEPLELLYEELLLSFQRMVKRGGPREMGMVVADRAKYEQIIQPLVREWATGQGTRFGRLTRLVEVPLFVDSEASRLTQIADLIAHASWTAYERGSVEMLDLLRGAFPANPDGRLDTLFHITGRHATCECPSCSSRRGIERRPEYSVTPEVMTLGQQRLPF